MKIKLRLLNIILFLCLFLNTFGQDIGTKSRKAAQAFMQAKEHFQLYMFSHAIESLKEATQHDPGFVDAYLMLAQIYFEIDSSRYQVEALNKALELDSECFPPAYINRAEGLILLGKYNQALTDVNFFIDKYMSRYEKFRPLVDLVKRKCEFAIDALKNPLDIELIPLPEYINTFRNEYWPSFTVDNQQFYYTMQTEIGVNRSREDIWTSTLKDATYSRPKPIGEPVNTRDNEGASFISPDGRYILFTGCNRADGFGSCDIYMTVRKDNEWLKPRNLGKTVNGRHWDARPVISSDGTQLYFASNRPGGFGKSDLYKCNLVGYDGDGFPIWDKPINLGSVINTEGNEMAPFIHPDNITLYFSSDFHPGMGRLDLFKTVLVDGKWSEPMNLGYPINTSGAELGIFVQSNGKTAFIDKEVGTSRQRDIFHFELPTALQAGKATYVKGKVVDMETKLPLVAVVDLYNFVSSDPIMSISSNSNGEFLIALVAGKKYGLTVDRISYLFYSDHFIIDNVDVEAYELHIELEPIRVGSRTVLNNVFFETDSFVLSPESKTELDRVVKFLSQNPTVKVEISGHTDDRGSAAYNQKLSENRSKAVYSYIMENGIVEGRLTFVGYGASKPIESNLEEKGRSKNRRTEMKILEN
jgi:flagellar motor protein MotB